MNFRNINDEQALAILEKEHPNLSSIIQLYPPELGYKLLNNKEKLQKLSKKFTNIVGETCVNTLVMECRKDCIYKNVCFFVKNDIAPIGYSCPIEKQIIIDIKNQIVETLDIEESDPIEMEMLWDLIDAKLLDMRASGKLKDGRLVQIVEQKVGGNVIKREEAAPTIFLKLEIKKLKHNIIDSFVATRRAKKKYGMKSEVNTLEQLLRSAAENVSTEES